ncbi:hypothetical protein [Quadrisphaera setariae]|uniref:Uncharacterized protein n=1 Tax=Quadrisphaera setariae TaxID=2593304 RepID=A0A5C8ZF57_9ACTN|nr:hypothetical protein [Quadrisphaera setariae]TXR56477.1 hypothetical protein FMM08_10345 [Quadrisphaera setariae]
MFYRLVRIDSQTREPVQVAAWHAQDDLDAIPSAALLADEERQVGGDRGGYVLERRADKGWEPVHAVGGVSN